MCVSIQSRSKQTRSKRGLQPLQVAYARTQVVQLLQASPNRHCVVRKQGRLKHRHNQAAPDVVRFSNRGLLQPRTLLHTGIEAPLPERIGVECCVTGIATRQVKHTAGVKTTAHQGASERESQRTGTPSESEQGGATLSHVQELGSPVKQSCLAPTLAAWPRHWPPLKGWYPGSCSGCGAL